MSGILLTQLHSSELGGMALLTDLFREIFAILLMYCFGGDSLARQFLAQVLHRWMLRGHGQAVMRHTLCAVCDGQRHYSVIACTNPNEFGAYALSKAR